MTEIKQINVFYKKDGNLFLQSFRFLRDLINWLHQYRSEKTLTMNKILLVFPFLLATSTLFSQQLVTLRVDPDNARGGTASRLFDSVRFIPLETTKESLFGSVDQLEVTDSLFIILDIRGRSVLLFNRNGKFRQRITTGGIDRYFNWFCVDRKTGRILIRNNGSNSLSIYDLEGKFISKVTCPNQTESFFLFGGDTILFNLRRPFDPGANAETPYDLAYSAGYQSVVRKLGHYDSKVSDGEYNIECNPFNFSGEPGSCMFSIPFDYRVFQLGDTGILREYRFIFPFDYSLPANFTTDIGYKNKRAQYVYTDRENAKKIHSIERMYKIDQYLLFTASSLQMRIGADWNYLYNTRTNDLISFSKVTADSSTYFFPLLSSVFENVEAVSGHHIFSSMPSFRLLSYTNTKDKKVDYPEELNTLLATGSKHDNVVIIEFVLKPTL
jgi:hypothetical protein